MPGDSSADLTLAEGLSKPELSQDIGTAMAFQVVSQATAASVVDGAAYLRGVSMISSAAIGTMTAGMIQQINEGGSPNSPKKWQDAISQVQQNLITASSVYKQIGEDAAAVLKVWKDL